MQTTYDDEFYRDLLEGLALWHASDFQRDVLRTLSEHQVPGLGEALNKNQVASKQWLVDALREHAGTRFGHLVVLGGWLGVLAAMLLSDRRFTIGHVTSLDIDPRCAPVATTLNARHAAAGLFDAATRDMLDVDHAREYRGSEPGAPDVIVNTSCEHLSDLGGWYRRLPAGRLVVLQSNDYFACDEHVSCVPDLSAFREQAPLREVLFAGERRMRRYTRFMLIGRT